MLASYSFRMDTRALDPEDRALVDAAREVIERQHVPGWNTVGAAMRTAKNTMQPSISTRMSEA
jgi:hypothetical protein